MSRSVCMFVHTFARLRVRISKHVLVIHVFGNVCKRIWYVHVCMCVNICELDSQCVYIMGVVERGRLY